MRQLSILLLTLLFISCSKQDALVEYEVASITYEGQPALEITLTTTPDPDGITEILYQNNAWGEEDLYNSLKDPVLLSAQGALEVNRDSGWIAIKHGANDDPLRLQYTLIQDTPFSREGQDPTYRPIIQPEYFHVFGHNLFAVPKHLSEDSQEEARVDINWEGWTDKQIIHNSFGSQQRKQALRGITWQEFHSSIFVGGDYRIHEEEINGNRLLLAIRGDWIPFNDTEVREVLLKTVTAQRNFWEDHSQNYFTVTMRPFSLDRGSSYGGTGLTNSFATSMSNNSETDLSQLVHLFNHELMHNWIGHAIENADEEAQYWFSEGFTEYYAVKNIAKNEIGGLDIKYLYDHINEKIRLLKASPVGEAPNSEITYENFWRDREYSELPYRRGFLYAFYLDTEISRAHQGEKSLDDVMLKILKNANESDEKISRDSFLKVLKEFLPEDPEPFFEEHIEQGKWIDFTTHFEKMGLDFEVGAELFDLGFQTSEDGTEIISVSPGSAAEQAGLKAGDQLASRSIYFGRTDIPVELGVRQGKAVNKLSFYAVRNADIPQLSAADENRVLLTP